MPIASIMCYYVVCDSCAMSSREEADDAIYWNEIEKAEDDAIAQDWKEINEDEWLCNYCLEENEDAI